MSENKTYRLDERSALAQARHVRMTPMKTRRIVDQIRGMKADRALESLQFAPQTAAVPVGKVIASAVANATHNKNLNPYELWISQAYVDEGPTIKRIRPRAQGRAYRIRKRTSHITIVVQERDVVEPQKQRPPRKVSAGAGMTAPSAKTTSKTTAKKTSPQDGSTDKAISTQEGAK